jgi:regulator of protease activity HflC (stomatin/prohibitin superfamily)
MADMTLTQAADEVRKLLRGFKAVDMVSTALDSVGSLQNAGKEAEKALADTRALIDAHTAELAVVKAEVADAKDEAKKIVADAKRKADERLAKAEADIAARTAEVNAFEAAAVVRVQALEAQASAARDAVVVAQKELEDITGKIAKAKAGVAKILGQ